MIYDVERNRAFVVEFVAWTKISMLKICPRPRGGGVLALSADSLGNFSTSSSGRSRRVGRLTPGGIDPKAADRCGRPEGGQRDLAAGLQTIRCSKTQVAGSPLVEVLRDRSEHIRRSSVVRRLFVRIGKFDETRFGKFPPQKLETDRKPVVGKASWYDDCREPRM